MGKEDFFANEKSVTVQAPTPVRIEFVGKDGTTKVLKDKTPLLAGDLEQPIQGRLHRVALGAIRLHARNITRGYVSCEAARRAVWRLKPRSSAA
jgi:hypothetical protein